MSAERWRSERDCYLALAFCWADLLFQVEDGQIRFAAGAMEPLLGVTAESLNGQPLHNVVAPEDHAMLDHLLLLIARHGRLEEAIVRLRGPQGRRFRVAMTGHGLTRAGETSLYIAMRSRLASEHPGEGDESTAASGLLESSGFSRKAATRLKSGGEGEPPAELALVSMSNAEPLMESLPPVDRQRLAANIGACLRAWSVDGECAVALSPGKYGALTPPGADMSRLREEVAQIAEAMGGGSLGVTVDTAAIACGDRDSIDEYDLARGLTYTMNEFSRSEDVSLGTLAGRMSELVGRTVTRISQFRELVQLGRFNVAMQPIVHARSGQVHHFEALCRFRGGERSEESPFQLIQFAEETGLIHWLDLAMAGKVIERMSRLPRNGNRFRIAVNVSGRSLLHPEYQKGLQALLEEHDWVKGRLMFEITESARIAELQDANDFIQDLRGRGFQVSLDDFGAGAASFQYLSKLDVDAVKIDGAAIRNALTAPKGRAFLSALTELCRKMGVETVAEMIDSREALEFVRACGCDHVQGYLFGKPSTDMKSFAPLPNGQLFAPLRY